MPNEYKDNWITTFTGRQFHYLNPSPDEVDIRDIAHALSLKVRFSGHCLRFYSVAEHCLRVAEILPEGLQLSGLLHDAAEAYIPDIPRPIKEHYGLREAEDKILKVILEKFGLVEHPLIREADDVILATEARDLMANMDGWAKLPKPLRDRIIPRHKPHTVEIAFLHRFKTLYDK